MFFQVYTYNKSIYLKKQGDGSLFYTLKILLIVNLINLDNCLNELPSSSFKYLKIPVVFVSTHGSIKKFNEFSIIIIYKYFFWFIPFNILLYFTFTCSSCFSAYKKLTQWKLILLTVIGYCQTKNRPLVLLIIFRFEPYPDPLTFSIWNQIVADMRNIYKLKELICLPDSAINPI